MSDKKSLSSGCLKMALTLLIILLCIAVFIPLALFLVLMFELPHVL